MRKIPKPAGFLATTALLLAGCEMPGHPTPGSEVPRPETVISFDSLYNENCSGCHGANGTNGPATDLANPEYEALIDDASLRDVIANGEEGTLMPGFGLHARGNLSDAQINAIAHGMRARWRTGKPLSGANIPPYKAVRAGNVLNGQADYMAACARCHGVAPQHSGQAGTILDGSFLALINEQTIRTTILAGRPDIGEPDWRNHIPGRPMTDEEVTDVTAWLMAQKPTAPGQPYPTSATTATRPPARRDLSAGVREPKS
jgi:cytochrome c oxidase cbb3-type subunit III